MFLNLPPQCEIKIYTERGDLIKSINHNDGSGDEAWDSVTSTRQLVTSGIYLANIKVTEAMIDANTDKVLLNKDELIIKKFIVIR